jgi:uncharacterized Rossmann fold enzyme
LAEEFEAKEIILVGMEFGDRIGKYSKDVSYDIEVKKRKLQAGKKLLEMLAKYSRSQLFDTSTRPVKGFVYFKIDKT